MPVQITINGADAAESIQELSVLAAAISGQKMPAQEEKPKRQRTTKTEKKQEEEPEKPDVTEDEGSAGEEDIPTMEELREAASAKGKTAGKDAVKALLKNEFGSSGLTTLPEEQRAAFLVRLKAL